MRVTNAHGSPTLKERRAVWLSECMCVYVCVFQVQYLCVCACHKRSGEEPRWLHESLKRMSGMHKNTTKEPETESCGILLLYMKTLNTECAHQSVLPVGEGDWQ